MAPRKHNSPSSSSSFPQPQLVDEAFHKGKTTLHRSAFPNGNVDGSGVLLNYGSSRLGGQQSASSQSNYSSTDTNKPIQPTCSRHDSTTSNLRKDDDPQEDFASLSAEQPYDVWMGYINLSGVTDEPISVPASADDAIEETDTSPSTSAWPTCASPELIFEDAEEHDMFGLIRDDFAVEVVSSPYGRELFIHSDDEVDEESSAHNAIASNCNMEKLCDFAIAPVQDGQAGDHQEPTPALSASWSNSPTSEVVSMTPTDSCLDKQDAVGTSSASRNRRGKQSPTQATLGTREAACNVSSPRRAANKRRRSTSYEIEELGESDRDIGELSPCEGLSKLFESQFLLDYFTFARDYDGEQTWACPFLQTPNKRDNCETERTAKELQLHIRQHCNSYEELHPGAMLPCPLKDSKKDECRLRGASTKQVLQIGPNDSLARHIVDGHYKARRVQCVCGKPIGRAVKDQVVRHLLTRQHQNRLAEKLAGNSGFREYRNIRDPLLLDAQRAWKDGGIQDDNGDDDKEEGPSNGRKRARRS